MNNFTEKRAFGRFHYKAPITYAYFNSDCFLRGKTYNHSDDGMFLETDVPLRLGSTIYVRVENFSPDVIHSEMCSCSGFKVLSLAEVRWCTETVNSNNYYFGIGLKYTEKDLF